ncbi:hypothetical protein OB905_06415 [Halobacteria archaeon AArc-dxtr1]|nr:hypothetical protein [Halobacteria archaeon AArc-dxtr1]
MSDIGDLAETGLGVLVLAFGFVTAATVYVTGSLASLPVILDRFAGALVLAMVPSMSLAAWPTAIALFAGLFAALRIDDRAAIRLSAFLAVYLFLAVLLYYVVPS